MEIRGRSNGKSSNILQRALYQQMYSCFLYLSFYNILQLIGTTRVHFSCHYLHCGNISLYLVLTR